MRSSCETKVIFARSTVNNVEIEIYKKLLYDFVFYFLVLA